MYRLDPGIRDRLPPEDVEDSDRALAFLLETAQSPEQGTLRRNVRTFARQILARIPKYAWQDERWIELWKLLNPERPEDAPIPLDPQEFEPVAIADFHFDVRGQELCLWPADHADSSANIRLGEISSLNRYFLVHAAGDEGQERTENDPAFWKSGAPPPFATRWDQDEYGPWFEFEVRPAQGPPAVQRLRWIPPGDFMMRSPGDDPGRFPDEVTHHSVTITNGFWIFDTTCTQALWSALEKETPSDLELSNRPVVKAS